MSDGAVLSLGFVVMVGFADYFVVRVVVIVIVSKKRERESAYVCIDIVYIQLYIHNGPMKV